MDVVNHDEVGHHARCDGAYFVVPVRGQGCPRRDHLDHFVIGENIAEHLIVPKVCNLQFMQR